MIKDRLSEFSRQQAITAVGDTASTKTLDYGADVDIGVGEPLWLYCQVDETVQAPGKATVQVRLQTDDTSDFAHATTAIRSGPFDKALLTKGFAWHTRLPMGLKRHYRVLYTVTSEEDKPLTQGKLSAGFVLEVPAHRAYPSGLQRQPA